MSDNVFYEFASSANKDSEKENTLDSLFIDDKDIATEVESVVEVPENNNDVKTEVLELVSETVLEPIIETKPENVIDATPEVAPVQEPEPKKINTDNKIAIYALRTLTLPSGTIAKGYSYVSKSEYEKISKHKAVRLASKEEIAKNL